MFLVCDVKYVYVYFIINYPKVQDDKSGIVSFLFLKRNL